VTRRQETLARPSARFRGRDEFPRIGVVGWLDAVPVDRGDLVCQPEKLTPRLHDQPPDLTASRGDDAERFAIGGGENFAAEARNFIGLPGQCLLLAAVIVEKIRNFHRSRALNTLLFGVTHIFGSDTKGAALVPVPGGCAVG